MAFSSFTEPNRTYDEQIIRSIVHSYAASIALAGSIAGLMFIW